MNDSGPDAVPPDDCFSPHPAIVSATREISWRTLVSRLGVPICPRKYFETTTLVAVCDHARGTSTSFCSNTIRPSSPEITALRKSHSTSENGSTPALVKNRSRLHPCRAPSGAVGALGPRLVDFDALESISDSVSIAPPPITTSSPNSSYMRVKPRFRLRSAPRPLSVRADSFSALHWPCGREYCRSSRGLSSPQPPPVV